MKFSELLTDFDEKKQAVMDSIAESDRLEEGANLFIALEESDYMEDVAQNPDLILQDDCADAVIASLKDEANIKVDEEKKESFKSSLSEYFESRITLLESAVNMCNEVVTELNSYDFIDENIICYISSDLTEIVFLKEEENNANPICSVSFDCLKEDDYKNAIVSNVLCDIVFSDATIESHFINNNLPDGYDFLICIAEPSFDDGFLMDSFVEVHLCDKNEGDVYILSSSLSVSDYIKCDKFKHLECIKESVEKNEEMFEYEKDTLVHAIDSVIDEFKEEVELDLIEKEISAFEIEDFRDLDFYGNSED